MREQIIPAQTLFEEIKSFEHEVGRWVRVLVGQLVNNEFPPQQFDAIMIEDIPERRNSITGELIAAAVTDYTDLLSPNPDWAPNKPAGTFRKEDLWRFIDLVRSRR
jgi:hypothetical protein